MKIICVLLFSLICLPLLAQKDITPVNTGSKESKSIIKDTNTHSYIKTEIPEGLCDYFETFQLIPIGPQGFTNGL